MAIGKIFGFGSTGLRFDSQRNNAVFGQNNSSSTNSLPVTKYSIAQPPNINIFTIPQPTLPQNNGSLPVTKYSIAQPILPQNSDNNSNTNEPPVLKYAIPNPDDNTNEPPVLKYAIPSR